MDRVVIFYARLRANDPKAILAYRRLKGLAPTDPRCAAILAKLRRLAAASMAQMSTGAEPAHLLATAHPAQLLAANHPALQTHAQAAHLNALATERAPLQGHLLTAARPTVRPRVWRPEGRPGFRPGPGRPGGFHPGLRPAFAGPHAVLHGLRPGGYRASWAYGRNRFFHPGTGWTSGWFGWRRPGWRGWGWRPNFGWVWGYPGIYVIDASDPTQILMPQADGSATQADPSQLPAGAAQTPDPSTAPPPDGSTDDGTPDSDDDEAKQDNQADASDDSDDSNSSDANSAGAWGWRGRPRRPVEPPFGEPFGRVFGRPVVRRRWRKGWPHHIRANTPPPPPAPLALPRPPPPAPPAVDASGRGFGGGGFRPPPPGFGRRPPPPFGFRPRPPFGGYQPGVFGAPAYGPGAPGQLAQLEAISSQMNAANPAGDDPNAAPPPDSAGHGYGGLGHGGFSPGGGFGGWGRRGWAGAGRGYGLLGGMAPGVYVPVYAEPLADYGDTSALYGDNDGGDATGAVVLPDLGSMIAPYAAAAGPDAQGWIVNSVRYAEKLGAQAASNAGLQVSQGSTPAEAVADPAVTSRAAHAANSILQHTQAAPLAAAHLQQAAKIAHAHVRASAKIGAANPPPAGWTMQPVSAQRALALLGFYKGPINGIVDKATREAAKAFQAAVALTADGIIGHKTQPILEQCAQSTLAANAVQHAQGTTNAAAGLGTLLAAKPWIAPAVASLLGGALGSRWGRPKPGFHLPHRLPAPPSRGERPRPPAWPPHVLAGVDSDTAETVREALKKALQGFPLSPEQSVALKKYLADKTPSAPPPNSSGYLPGWNMPLARNRDWLGNPEYPYLAVGQDEARIAVGGPVAAMLLGAAGYAGLQAYRQGWPAVASTTLGPYWGARLAALVHQGIHAAPNVTAGYDHPWRPMYGRPGTGLPQRMRAGIDTSSQSQAVLPSAVSDALAASMRRAVV